MLDSISLFRIIKTGITNFGRNLWLSAAATMVMTITLVIFATLFLLFMLTNYSIKTIENTVDVSVYFKTGLAEERIKTIQEDLSKDPKIKEIDYVSAQQAFEDFKKNHENDPLIVQSINELTENPLPATLHIKTHELSDYPLIAEQLQSETYRDFVEKVNFEDNRLVIERLEKILKFIITFGLGLIIVFSVIAVLVIYNTITLTIYNRKEEIEIMRLVGATNWYIQGPFLVESLVYSILSSALTTILFIPIFTKILPKVVTYVNPQVSFYSNNLFNLGFLILALLGLAIFLSVLSTILAIRKYLKI